MVAWLGGFERSERAAKPPIMFFIRSAMSGTAPPASAAPVSSPIGFTPTRRGRSCAPANATKHAQSNLRMTAAWFLSASTAREGKHGPFLTFSTRFEVSK